MLTREGVLDAMTVEVESVPGGALAEVDRSRKADEVARHIKAMIGVTCNVMVKPPGEVPRSQGKAVRVKDQRRK